MLKPATFATPDYPPSAVTLFWKLNSDEREFMSIFGIQQNILQICRLQNGVRITHKSRHIARHAKHQWVGNCSARDWERIRNTWGNPQSGCSDICSYSQRATVGVCAPMRPSETPVWSESSVDERNLYFARSAIIGLAVETWRVKTELIIITILHIIIITTSISNLGFQNICAKNIGVYNMHK